MSRLRRTAIFAALAATLVSAPVLAAEQVVITATPIEHLGHENKSRFGALLFIGGLLLESDNDDFGGLSGLRLTQDGTRLFMISDRGRWFSTAVRRFDRRLEVDPTFSSGSIRKTNSSGGKRSADAEALEVDGDHAYIAYERRHRVERYSITGNTLSKSSTVVFAAVSALDLPANHGLEALAKSPDGSPLAGAFIAIAEEPGAGGERYSAFVLRDGKALQPFAIASSGGYSATDADFGPDGNLYLLERQYSIITGPAMRIRRFDADTVDGSDLAFGEVLAELAWPLAIDNMEGLDVWLDASGETRLTLVSDDNFNFWQKSLLLEFKLAD